MTLKTTLIDAAERHCRFAGISKARLASIVVNDGKFFDRIERGGSFTARTYERFMTHFAAPLVQAAIAHYRTEREGAPERLDWGKAQRAQAAHQRRMRLGLGVREVVSPVDHGTEQTRAKLRTDVIRKLHDGGHLRDEHVAAAEEINRLVLAFMRGLFPSSRPLDGTRGGGNKGGTRQFLDPADRLSLWEARKWSECYAPWSREMGDEWLSCRRGRLNRLGLVWAVVLDNMGPRQLEQTHGMRHGSARKVLAEALWRYAEISGIYRGR